MKKRCTYHTKKPKYNIQDLCFGEEILTKFDAHNSFKKTNNSRGIKKQKKKESKHIEFLFETLFTLTTSTCFWRILRNIFSSLSCYESESKMQGSPKKYITQLIGSQCFILSWHCFFFFPFPSTIYFLISLCWPLSVF